MKFSINRVQLLNALNVVSRAVNSKNPNVTLTGIKLELNDLGLTLIGTDSNIAICTFIPLTSNNETNITLFEPGETILSAKYITDIVRKLDCDLIELDLVENTLIKIRDTNSDFSLNTMSTIDYPAVDFSASGSSFIIPGITLKLIIENESKVEISYDNETYYELANSVTENANGNGRYFSNVTKNIDINTYGGNYNYKFNAILNFSKTIKILNNTVLDIPVV